MMDTSMLYLQQHDLERVVGEALVQVVNERAANPRIAMGLKLLDSDQHETKAMAKMEARVNDLLRENAELRSRVEQMSSQQSGIERTANDLTTANAVLEKRCKQLEERGASLERWLKDSASGAIGALTPTLTPAPPGPPNAASSAPMAAASAEKPKSSASSPAPPAVSNTASARQLGRFPMWGELFVKLDPRGDGSGSVTTARVKAFAKALEIGCAETENPKEKVCSHRHPQPGP